MKLVLLHLLGITSIALGRHNHFYRKDYTYNEEFDAFYKLHQYFNGTSNCYSTAFMSCDDEGAKLFYPKEEGEWKVVKELNSGEANDTVTDIYVGLHDEFALNEFITVDGHSTSSPLVLLEHTDDQRCVLMNIDSGAYSLDTCQQTDDSAWGFVCKKVDDYPCPTIDRGYWHEKDTRKCYKLNTRPKTWHGAMQTCFLEGGTLLTIESNHENNLIYSRLSEVSINTRLFTGFRKMFSDRYFYNVKGTKLDDSGYNRWYSNEDTKGSCGTTYIRSDAMYYMAIDCLDELPFICEMDAKF